MNLKYDTALEAEAAAWIEAITGDAVSGSLEEALKDGKLLCKYVLRGV